MNKISVQDLSLLAKIKSIPWLETIFAFMLGGTAVFLHARFNSPLHLPGHHGLEWIALLAIARLTGSERWSGSISALGAAGFSLLPLWGLSDPFFWVLYLAAGFVMDLAYQAAKPLQNNIWFLTLLGGLAHATKPLIRFGITLTIGWWYGSLSLWNNFFYPLSMHFLFGMAGAFLGASLVHGFRLIRK